MADNLTLGRGEIHFALFKDAIYTPAGERYFGNTPEFSLTIEEETLEHFSSDRGIREKDDSISLETTRTGQLVTDNISVENVALFFFGAASVVADAGATVLDEQHVDVQKGYTYQLGISSTRPTGAKSVASVTVRSAATGGTLYVANTDYTLDAERGRITILTTGSIAEGADIFVDYTIQAKSFKRVISGSSPVEGAMRFLAKNPKGENHDFYFPRVQIKPNGDYALKGEDWQQIPFTIDILKRTDREAIYRDGLPYTP